MTIINMNKQIKNNKTVPLPSGEGTEPFNRKKWKGGRLKKRFKMHAQMIGQLTNSFFVSIESFLKACWLSPVDNDSWTMRGKGLTLYCSELLIDKRIIRRRK